MDVYCMIYWISAKPSRCFQSSVPYKCSGRNNWNAFCCRTVLELSNPELADVSGAVTFFTGVGRFCLMFFASSAVGVIFGLASAVISFRFSQENCHLVSVFVIWITWSKFWLVMMMTTAMLMTAMMMMRSKRLNQKKNLYSTTRLKMRVL